MKKEIILGEESESLTVYKLGDHTDVTDGPLIPNTGHIGRFAVTKVLSFITHTILYCILYVQSYLCIIF